MRRSSPGQTALVARFLNPTAVHVRWGARASETTKRVMAFLADQRFCEDPDPTLEVFSSLVETKVKLKRIAHIHEAAVDAKKFLKGFLFTKRRLLLPADRSCRPE